MLITKLSKGRKRYYATRCPVRVKIGNYKNTLLLSQCIDQQFNGRVDALEPFRRDKILQAKLQLFDMLDLTLTVNAPQERMHRIRKV